MTPPDSPLSGDTSEAQLSRRWAELVSVVRAELENCVQDPELLFAVGSDRSLSLPLSPVATWAMYFSTAEILGEPPEALARRFCEQYLQAQQEHAARRK